MYKTHGKTTMAYLLLLLLLLLIRTSVRIDVFTGCMPPKTAWDRAQRRSECELNFIHQSRVLKQWKRDQEIDTSYRVPNNISYLSKWTPKYGARTERTWYLIWKAADRCLLKVGHSDCCWRDCWRSFVSFRCKSFRNTYSQTKWSVPLKTD